MNHRFLILPALCLALLFGCDTERRDAASEQDLGTEPEHEIGYAIDTERTTDRTMVETAEENQALIVAFASISRLEVALSQLALERAESEKIKALAQMLVRDHKQINERLQEIAHQQEIDIPETMIDDHREEVEKLQQVVESEFDAAYLEMIVSQHERAIEMVVNKLDDVQNEQLESYFKEVLLLLRQHRQEAEDLWEEAGGAESIGAEQI